MSRDRILLAAALALGILLAWWQGASIPLLSYAAGAAGLAAVHERLRRSFESAAALITTILLFAATSLFWSMTRDPLPAEAISFAVAAGVLVLADRASVPAARLAGAAIAATAPLFARALAGSVAPEANAASGIEAALFSSAHGLFALSPIAYVGFAGLIAYAIRDRRSGAVALGAFLVMLLALRAWPVPAVGPSGHHLTAALAVLAPGLAFAIERARAKPWLAVVPLVAFVAAWNYWLMVQYTVGTLPKDEPVSFAGMVRQQFDVHTRAPYVYPFALPASAWFAWREGVPIDRYELLAFEPRQPAVDLTMDRRADRFLLDGWEAGAEGANGPQWIREPRAHLTIPLAPPSGQDLEVTLTARARLEEPAVKAAVALEVNGHEIARFVVPPTAPVDLSARVPADAVGRIWRAGYNRLTFVSYGVERVDPSDTRPPGPLASRPPGRAWPVAIYRVRVTPS